MAKRGDDRSARGPRRVKSEALGGLDLDFSNNRTVWKMLNDNSFFRGLMGPVGSGKSYASAAEIMLRAVRQDPSQKDNIRYSRWVVIRNSYPELRSTTIKTWLEIFPENQWGAMRWSPPLTHHIKLPARDEHPGLDCEVIFLALDQPKDVRKLLSLEVTGGWVNVAREIPLVVLQHLSSRCGRFPSKANGGPTWRGIWADTNPMDSDHWWYRLAEKEKVRGKFPWKFFRQPPGMLECAPHEDASFGADRHWRLNEKAENLKNLPPGYYEQQLGGKDLDWIRCYVGAEYVFVSDGKSVWGEYIDSQMATDGIELDHSLPIIIGLDFGLTPAAVFAQRTRSGTWHILHELVTQDMGLERFGQMLLYELNTRFKACSPEVWGDPSGGARDQIFEVTSFDHLRSIGINARPTASNDFMVRREAGAAPMTRLINGRPGLLVHSKCNQLRKSLAGGYHFKRMPMIQGQERFRDVPVKNMHSHIGDAFGYCLLGGGEHRRLVSGNFAQQLSQVQAPVDFNVFG